MKSQTKQQIHNFIGENGPTRPAEIVNELKISPQMIHRHLKSLIADGLISKSGLAPKVYYQLVQKEPSLAWPSLPEEITDYVNKNYFTVTPEGKKLSGKEGFAWWAKNTNQKTIAPLVNEYVNSHRKYTQEFRNEIELIDATFKLKSTFPEVYLDVLLYEEFYSLPKFGKTKSGQLVYLAKSGQDRNAIHELALTATVSIKNIVDYYRIDALVFTPHSIPRKTPLLPELRTIMDLEVPEIKIFKLFAENVPIAQKSLSKLADRVSNAQTTIFLETKKFKFRRILVIDDAVGSGATLNSVAMKLKKSQSVEFICGYALTGSLKGFEVIKEI